MWVRPVLMIGMNCFAFRARDVRSWRRAGSRSSWIAIAQARLMAVGITSLEDWQRLTWSFGCTLRPAFSALGPRIWLARLAITTLALVLVEVPEPVWYTSIGNSSSHLPSATSSAAWTIAATISMGT